MTTVKCLKCGKGGYLIIKQTVSKRIRYQYWYVKHIVDKKTKWCYIGKTLPTEYRTLAPAEYRMPHNRAKSTQTGTQRTIESNSLKSSSDYGNVGGRSLAWLGHRLPKPTTRVQIPVTAPYMSTLESALRSGKKNAFCRFRIIATKTS